MIVLWLSPPTFHPHLLNASSSLVRVGVWTGFGSHPTAQTTPDLKLMFFLSGYNSQPSSYPDVCGPKYLSKIGSIEALGNSCGSYSFLIWIPLSWSSLKSTETKICCTQYIKIQKYCQCIHRPTCFWFFSFLTCWCPYRGRHGGTRPEGLTWVARVQRRKSRPAAACWRWLTWKWTAKGCGRARRGETLLQAVAGAE